MSDPIIPVEHDLLIPLGTSWAEGFQPLDGEEEPISLAGYTAHAQLRASRTRTVAHPLDCSIVAVGEGSEIVVSLLENADIPPGTYRWDLLLEDADGIVTGPYVEGIAVAQKTYTQI